MTSLHSRRSKSMMSSACRSVVPPVVAEGADVRAALVVDVLLGLAERVEAKTGRGFARKPRLEQQVGNVKATIDGVTYRLGVNQGAIGTFHPVGMSEP